MGEGLIMSTRQQPGVHIIPQIVIYGDINVVYVQKVESKFAQSQLRKSDCTRSKDLILSFFPHTHKVLTFAQLKPPLLCTSSFACLWYIFAVFSSVQTFWWAPSVPAAHNNKKALCVFYIFCCRPAPLEIRGLFFMHGFSECQLPTHLWIQEYEGGLRESSLWTIIQLCCSFSTVAEYRGGGWNRERR